MTTIKFNVPGSKRKELAKDIASWLGTECAYAGAPTFAYKIGENTIDKNGELTLNGLENETVERLLEHLYEVGFESESLPTSDNETEQTAEAAETETTGIAIQIPATDFSETALANLRALLEAKATLIKHALGVDDLSFGQIEDRLDFPWFDKGATPEELHAYMTFLTKLCEMAKTQKRVTAKEKEIENEKYAFRCFLLRLDFMGDEYKTDRKILLSKLEGSSAFKSGKKKEDEE